MEAGKGAAAATTNAGDLRIRGIRWSEQEEDPEDDDIGNHGRGGFQLHADVSALTTTFDQHTNDGGMGMETPMAAKIRPPMSTPSAVQDRGLPNHPRAKTPSSILRTPSASATAVSSPMATPKLSPIHHGHNDQRSIVSAAVTNAASAAAVPASGSNRERHLSNQIATLKAKLGESNANRTEQQEQIWTLTHRLQQMEAEAESTQRGRNEVQTKLTTTAERIGRALNAIFAVLDGAEDDVKGGNLKCNFAASTIPITDDVDVVVSRLVDDALPMLQRRAVQSSRTLVEAKAELGSVQSEISAAQEQLQALEKDQAEAEHEAVAARDRTKSIRMELSAVDEQLSSGRNDLAHVQETIAALHAEEREVESHLNEMRGEVKSKKEEAEELTKMAQERLEKAVAAEKSAKEAIDQSHVVKEGK